MLFLPNTVMSNKNKIVVFPLFFFPFLCFRHILKLKGLIIFFKEQKRSTGCYAAWFETPDSETAANPLNPELWHHSWLWHNSFWKMEPSHISEVAVPPSCSWDSHPSRTVPVWEHSDKMSPRFWNDNQKILCGISSAKHYKSLNFSFY